MTISGVKGILTGADSIVLGDLIKKLLIAKKESKMIMGITHLYTLIIDFILSKRLDLY